MAATTVESLELDVETNARSATDGLEALSNSLSKLKNATRGSGLSKLSEQLSGINKASSNAKGAENLRTMADAISTLGSVKISPTIEKHLNSIVQAANSLNTQAVQNLKDASTALQGMAGLRVPQFSKLDRTISNINKAGGATATGTNTTNAELALSTELATATSQENTYNSNTNRATQLTERLKNAVNSMGGVFQKGFSVASKATSGLVSVLKEAPTSLKQITSMFRSLGNTLKNNVTNQVKKCTSGLTTLLSSLKRIAFYRMIRSFFSQLTAAIKEGVNNLYQYSALMGGTFKSSMDSLATSFQYLKNSMGAMVSPLVNALAPAVDILIDKFVTLLNVVNQFFARLTGASTYTAAKKSATEYADSLSDVGSSASKAAKEIKDATLGIDELNIISQNDDTGSGSGSGLNTDYSSMFEEVEIDSGISDFVDNLVDAFENADWERLGTLLGEKFNEVIDSINWEGVGSKIGYYINAAVQTAYYFLKEADFVNLGNHVAEMLNAAIGNIDFEYIGRLWIRGIRSAIDFVAGFLGTLDWGLIASSASDFIIGAFSELADWFNEVDWGAAADSLYENVKGVITGIKWGEIANAFWEALWGAINAVSGFATGFDDSISQDIESALDRVALYVSGAELALGAILAFSGVNVPLGIALMASGAVGLATVVSTNWDGISSEVSKVLGFIEAALGSALLAVGAVLAFSCTAIPLGISLMAVGAATLGTAVATNWNSLAGDVQSALTTIVGIVSGALLGVGAVLAFSGVATPLGIGLMAAGAVGLVSTIALNWGGLTEKVRNVISTIMAIVGAAMLAIGAVLCFSGVGIPIGISLIAAGAVSLVSTVAANWNTIITKIKNVLNKIASVAMNLLLPLGLILCLSGIGIPIGLALVAAGAGNLASGGEMNWDSITDSVKTALDNISEKFGEFGKNVGKKLDEAKKTVTSWAGNVKEFFTKGADGKNALDSIREAASEWGENFKEGLSNTFDNMNSWVDKNIISPLNKAIEQSPVTELVVELKNTASEWWANAKSWWADATKDGVTLQSFVELAKQGWSTVENWIGKIPVLGQYIELLKQGWSTVKNWIGNIPTLGQYIELLKQGWSTVKNWVGNIPTLDQFIQLVKQGWSTVKNWVGNIPILDQGIQLVKNLWTTVKNWVGTIPVLDQGIQLIKHLWSSVKNWIGTIPVLDQNIQLAKFLWKTVKDWIGTIPVLNQNIGLEKSGWSTVGDWVKNHIGGAVSVTVSLAKGWAGSVRDWVSSFSGGGVITSNGRVTPYANGGVISNSMFDAIPKFASGDTGYHGSMFLAGENGPEIVGHVNGTTEVLNRFQLAEVMHSAIVSGMSLFEGYWRTIANQQISCANGIINAVMVSGNTMALAMAGATNVSYDPTESLSSAVYDTAKRTADESLTYDGMARAMASVYENYIESTLNEIATNTKTQADKAEATYVNIGGRSVNDAVITQQKANGYVFSK